MKTKIWILAMMMCFAGLAQAFQQYATENMTIYFQVPIGTQKQVTVTMYKNEDSFPINVTLSLGGTIAQFVKAPTSFTMEPNSDYAVVFNFSVMNDSTLVGKTFNGTIIAHAVSTENVINETNGKMIRLRANTNKKLSLAILPQGAGALVIIAGTNNTKNTTSPIIPATTQTGGSDLNWPLLIGGVFFVMVVTYIVYDSKFRKKNITSDSDVREVVKHEKSY
jgi:hypothetical protein